MNAETVSLSSRELTRALATLSQSLVKRRETIRDDIRRAAEDIRKTTPTQVAFDLATKHRELRVLGGLLQKPPGDRLGLLTIEGGLNQGDATAVLALADELDTFPDLVDALAWVLSPWFVRRPEKEAESGRPQLIVFLYADRDAAMAEALELHLAPLELHAKLIQLWSLRHLRAGQLPARETSSHLAQADVVVPLLSADFLNSESRMRELEMARSAGKRVVPVLLRPVLLGGTWLAGLRLLPRDGSPISSSANRDAAWANVVRDIHEIVLEQRAQLGAEVPAPRPPIVPENAGGGFERATPGLTHLVSWIHISDLHFGHGDVGWTWDQVLVLQTLRADVLKMLGRGVPAMDAILVTGDIAATGATKVATGQTESTEYTDAHTYLSGLASDVGLGPERVFVVPGNHDVQRSADQKRPVKRLVNLLRAGEERLDEALADAGDRELLSARLHNYLDFAARFAPACLDSPPTRHLFWHHRLEVAGARVRLIGLNTALLCSGDDDHGKLRLGTSELAKALTQPLPSSNEIVISLSHHPLKGGWLSDEKDADAWMRNNAHIHLSGHVHDPDTEQARSGAGALFVRVAAGAAHAEKQLTGPPTAHGYNLATIVREEDGALKLRVWPRRWTEKNKAFRPDVDNLPDGQEYAEHDLRLRLP